MVSNMDNVLTGQLTDPSSNLGATVPSVVECLREETDVLKVVSLNLGPYH